MQKSLSLSRRISILMIGLAILLNPLTAVGLEYTCPPNFIRVGLGLNLSSAEFAVAEGTYELIDYATQRVISSNVSGSWVIAPAGNNNIQVSYNGKTLNSLGSSLLILRPKDSTQLSIFRFKNKRYRGSLLIQNLQGKIQMVNLLDIEEYLYGVVGAEIGMSAPDEALKAQAVVSRTYALYHKQHPQLHYDVGITTLFQVYGGYDMETLCGARVKQAVDATKGQVIYYNGSIIQAFFHANSGGHTESCENVWYSSIPYIRPVSAPEDAHAIEVQQQEGWPAVTYQWEKIFTKQELNKQLQKYNNEHPNKRINVGEVLEFVSSRYAVNPVNREFLSYETASQRVTQLDIIGTSGISTFFKDEIRSVLDLRSTLFEVFMDSTIYVRTAYESLDTFNQTKNMLAVNKDGMISKLNGNNNSYYVVAAEGVKNVPKSFTTVIIRGKGYGHGLGMSQWGARGMAAQGSTYRIIIEHYYNQDKNDGLLQVGIFQ